MPTATQKDPHAGAWTSHANMADTLENRSGKGLSVAIRRVWIVIDDCSNER